jgi:hypothetical protein
VLCAMMIIAGTIILFLAYPSKRVQAASMRE